LVGFIDYAMTPEPGKGMWIAMINFFYVVPEHRETDAAGQLWKAAIESAKENKAVEFTSICFPERLEFWEKHGFSAELLAIRRVI
jgi:GNAT superfamily N-acetyltransferase